MTELSIPLIFHMIEIKHETNKITEQHNETYSALYRDGTVDAEYCTNTTCWD